MATSQNTVERRRANRTHTSEWNRQRSEERRDREEEESRIAARMVRRVCGRGKPVPLIMLNYTYWQARRCGWDACSVTLSRTADGKPCDPSDSAFWRWWTGLHPQKRRQLQKLSGVR